MALSDDPSFGNLRNAYRNPKAAQADLRVGRLTSSQLAMGSVRQGGGLAFDALMAVNESQNQVIGQVLEGPVSQQTQRQLAQLKAMSSQNPSLASLAKTGRSQGAAKDGQSLKAAEGAAADPRDGAIAAGSRIIGNLQGGRTVRKGLDTGKIFSPAQLSSFRKKNGLTKTIYQPPAEGDPAPKGASLASIAAAVAMEDAEASLKREAAGPMSQSAAAAAQKAYGQTEKDEATEKAGATKKGAANRDKLDAIIKKVGEALGLDPSLIKAVVKTESNFNQKAVSKAGAKGLMQLMPKTAKEMGVDDPFNAFENIWGGARYLKKMLDRQGGNLNNALAAYNWGPGNLDRHGSSRLPGETRRYIEAVNRNYARFKKESQMA
ncbi:MAG: lytic transglycosylase domain-containing protein [Deltaproteobacteria bacterium]|jgi:soluble lytic murein transglycosylase-like protein|nr:lytic transglycosylase domain-containing protein [Deltaproteobacteria bacterium]